MEQGISVRDFGAVADGIADDTAAIQKAIDAGSSLGREVWFPAGTYIVDPTRVSAAYPTGSKYGFEMRSNMHLRGNGNVTLKFKDGASTDRAPRRLNMFFSASALSNISFRGLAFDGNWTKNPISPGRHRASYNVYNQSFIGFWGPSARGDRVLIENCVFKNNAGANNIVSAAAPNGVRTRLGRGWTIRNTSHIDGGMDTNDFTAIFGYAEDMSVENNHFLQTRSPTSSIGPGARNAFEVHGSRTRFANNTVRSYFGGAIVTSNWTNPVSAVSVAGNSFTDMFAYGVRLWRQSSGMHVQTPVSGVRIANNTVQLNSRLYARPSDFKAGIYGAAATMSHSITDVVIVGNSVVQDQPAQNISAAVYLQGGTVPGQKHDRLEISANTASGTYYGIFIQSAGGGRGATWGTISVARNQIKNLATVGAHRTPIAYFFRGTGGLGIDNLIFLDNLAEEDARSPAAQSFGLWLQDSVVSVTQAGNRFVKVRTPYTDRRRSRTR